MGKLSSMGFSMEDTASVGSEPGTVNVVAHLCMVLKCNELDSDFFFTLFEFVSDAKNWPDSDSALMLQCIVIWKAPEAYPA